MKDMNTSHSIINEEMTSNGLCSKEGRHQKVGSEDLSVEFSSDLTSAESLRSMSVLELVSNSRVADVNIRPSADGTTLSLAKGSGGDTTPTCGAIGVDIFGRSDCRDRGKPEVSLQGRYADQTSKSQTCLPEGLDLDYSVIATDARFMPIPWAHAYPKLIMVGIIICLGIPLVTATLTISSGLRVSSGVGASASAISIIPLRTIDGVSSTAWIM